MPASDTGAIEMAMWSLLGLKDVEVCGWETFGLTWVKDITKQLKLGNVTVHKTDNYGELPDLSKVNFDRTDLSGKKISDSNFDFVSLKDTKMDNVDLSHTQLREVDLTEIKNKDLSNSNLFKTSKIDICFFL